MTPDSARRRAIRDDLGRVVCHHGRHFSCGECGEEYAEEIEAPPKPPTPISDAIQREIKRLNANSTLWETPSATENALYAFARFVISGKHPNPDDAMDVYVPGRWRCLECPFVLSQATLFVQSGTIGCTRDQVMRMDGELCPNDGTPMVRVTWREAEADAREFGERLIDDVLKATGAESLPAALEKMRAADAARASAEARIKELEDEHAKDIIALLREAKQKSAKADASREAMIAKLRELIAKYETQAARHKEHGDSYRIGQGWAMDDCAQDLAAVLASEQAEQEQG